MADDGLMKLEDDPANLSPAAVSDDAARILEADRHTLAVSTPTPVADDPDDGHTIPPSVVKELRGQLKVLKEQAKANEEAARLWQEHEPVVRFVQNNRDLLVQRVAEPVQPAPNVPAIDPDAREAALLMDFYKADGTPDDEKGARYLALQDKRAGRIAERQVQPILERTQQDQAQVNYQMAARMRDANGESPSEASLKAVWGAMPPELVADQRVAGVLAALALGLDRMNGPKRVQQPAPPATATAVSEPSGGNPRTRVEWTPLEQRIASERGVSATKWQELTKGYQPGRPTALED